MSILLDVPSWILDRIFVDTYKFKKITSRSTIFLNPCKKCLVRPACTKQKACHLFQKWYFKELFCNHNWKIDSMLMRLPTSLMFQCTKCEKIK